MKILDILLNSVSHRDGTQINHIGEDTSMYAVNGCGYHFKNYYLIWRYDDVVGVTKMYFFLYQFITSNWYIICYWISVYVKSHYFTNRLVYLVFIFGLFIIPKWRVHLWHFCHFFHAALLGIAKERAFVLTNPLFSNRKHHVDSFPATVKSITFAALFFFSTGSFELNSCGISQTTICEDFSRGFTELICWECCFKHVRLVTVYTIYGFGCCSLHFNDVFLQEKPLIAVGSFCCEKRMIDSW